MAHSSASGLAMDLVPLGAAAPADLSSEHDRQRLTRSALTSLLRLAEQWHLTTTEVRELLGDVPERTWFRLKKPEWTGALQQDQLTRISLLLGVFKSLRLLFAEPLAGDWVKTPNRGTVFGGQTPLRAMVLGGIPKMIEVRRHLDALRGGA